MSEIEELYWEISNVEDHIEHLYNVINDVYDPDLRSSIVDTIMKQEKKLDELREKAKKMSEGYGSK